MSNLAEAIAELRAHVGDPHPYMTMQDALLFVGEAADKDAQALRDMLKLLGANVVPPCNETGPGGHVWDIVNDQGFQRCDFCGVLRPIIPVRPTDAIDAVVDLDRLRQERH